MDIYVSYTWLKITSVFHITLNYIRVKSVVMKNINGSNKRSVWTSELKKHLEYDGYEMIYESRLICIWIPVMSSYNANFLLHKSIIFSSEINWWAFILVKYKNFAYRYKQTCYNKYINDLNKKSIRTSEFQKSFLK